MLTSCYFRKFFYSPTTDFNCDLNCDFCLLLKETSSQKHAHIQFIGHPCLLGCSINLALFIVLSVRSFVRSQRKISEIDHQFFLIFYMKLESHKIRKVTESNFFKKPVHIKRAHNGPKMPQKWGFCCLDKNLIHSCEFFLFEYQVTNGFLKKPLDQSKCRIL